MAPNWIITLKAFENSGGSSFTNSFTKIRWPVDDTGKNSVTPSTMERIKTFKNSIIKFLQERMFLSMELITYNHITIYIFSRP